MAYECDYCGRGQWQAGELRLVPDVKLGGARQMCCHDCYHAEDPCDDETCAFSTHQTSDEWAEDRQAYCEAVAEAKAEAHRARMQDEGLL